jgi:hypothetical protein
MIQVVLISGEIFQEVGPLKHSWPTSVILLQEVKDFQRHEDTMYWRWVLKNSQDKFPQDFQVSLNFICCKQHLPYRRVSSAFSGLPSGLTRYPLPKGFEEN